MLYNLHSYLEEFEELEVPDLQMPLDDEGNNLFHSLSEFTAS